MTSVTPGFNMSSWNDYKYYHFLVVLHWWFPTEFQFRLR